MAEWLQDVVSFAENNLTDREQDLLMGRGVSPDQMALYRIGRLNGELPDSVPGEFLKWAKDKIDDVYVFPLTTTLGTIKGLQLRHVDRKIPGYQDYFLPDKSEACLFGLGQAIKAMWETRTICLVEGCFDLFPIQRANPATVATLTAWCAPPMARIMRRIIDHVFVCYDNDAPGEKGAREFQERFANDFKVYVLPYPSIPSVKIKDPGDLWEAWGDAQLVSYLQTFFNNSLQET